MFRFANPYLLLLLLLIPAMIYWYVRNHRQKNSSATLRYSNLGIVKSVKSTPMKQLRHSLFVFRLIAVALMILAFARPQSGQKESKVQTEGVDIILAMDISSSMLAEDFKPKNRLEAAKVVAADFIRGRKNDRIGLVVFAAQSFTQCPLTLDYGIVLRFLEEVKTGMIDDGTAIGMAIGNCVNRLKDSKAKSKVVILLTDGRNNRGELDPITAARVAEAFHIRIYTIGAGKRGEALYPIDDPIFGKRYQRIPVQIDEDLLMQVADITGGQYFRATDKTSLEQIYAEIGEMEKTKIEVKEYTRYSELFLPYLLAALLLLLLEIVLANTKFRKIP
ncbi:VWA domain-containing protein [candidate division KSB1 bacterium]|nr:VWA domain-containing protein [candidate division KSB1 bacterium]RQW00583.1 MAG: VWA domain-containing protein [candidate division KSB1 bacterium]